MDTTKSTVRANSKPMNVFYVWYTELCRRMNCNPAPAVKPAKPKCQTVLEFVADRLKVEEWNPIVNALRNDTSLHVISIKSRISNCQFFHDIDTEDKARHMKRRFGSLWTAYILRQLVKSISCSLRNTSVLTCLELDGLPMFSQYLEPLLQGLKKNKTVKQISFANCLIYDSGCQLVCCYIKFTPNVEVLNLSGCGLSAESGEHLAKLIKYQQINRYCESWHNSLRYENPQSGVMRGIKRITINCNPEFGDTGLEHILDELEDDLWIKALDLQRCGITENLSNRITDVIQYNKSLEIVDLRQNDLLYISTIERVLQLLREKQQFGHQPEFQWCNTALTLTWNSVYESTSKFSFGTNIHKTKSAPTKTHFSKTSTFTIDQNIRKSKTVENIQKKNESSSDLKVKELNSKLQLEIQKRKKIEKRNEELQQKLELIQNTVKMKQENGKKSLKIVMDSTECKTPLKPMKLVPECTQRKNEHSKARELNGIKNSNGLKNGIKYGIVPNGVANGFKNGVSSKIINSACKIFENLLKKDTYVEINDDGDLLKHFTNDKQNLSIDHDNFSEISTDSQLSLYEYMEQVKKGPPEKYTRTECQKR
nr:centrosomal protein of 78 kDa [Leptinotarsa decemlineata]